MTLRPCLGCNKLIATGSRCHTCQTRNGSTRQWRTTREQILDRDHHTCHICGQPGATVVDHLIPKAYGGTDTPDNLAAAHAKCNTLKGTSTTSTMTRATNA